MDLNIYTIALLAINLVTSLGSAAYYFLRKKYKKTNLPAAAPAVIIDPPTSPFTSPEFVTNILERV